MYTVKWTENDDEKTKAFEDRDEAFRFQSGLVARKFNEKANIVPKGVWA